MLLAIDIGNTNVVIGLFQDSKLINHWRLSSTITRTADESWILIKLLFESENLSTKQVQGIAISSVVPNLTFDFATMAKTHFRINPIVVSYKLDLGIQLLYDTPETVGADRICNAVGGYFKHHGPLIIVDFGTATTFDVVAENGDYLGGIIAPSIELSASVLHQRAAMLPKVGLNFPPKVIGTTTETSIQSGLMFGGVEMVDGLVERIDEELNQTTTAIATGGLAHKLLERSRRLKIIEPYLTLEGLRLIYERVSQDYLGNGID